MVLNRILLKRILYSLHFVSDSIPVINITGSGWAWKEGGIS
ncbi:hypothetical protein ACPOL_2145 [Acidisarcina polymorpha]|uniref:Uncharacterized protein n=1 Tax=Acidisarcina polymorpha TaxID=2211140 RepID=A0A2Z5FX44_9BACT|nr:hypothetical protein ACPOL_2145 [Acidisarcina polymorpha]